MNKKKYRKRRERQLELTSIYPFKLVFISSILEEGEITETQFDFGRHLPQT
jgi:hypothetical protein